MRKHEETTERVFDSRFCCAVTFNSILNLARRCQMSHVVYVRSEANKGECINHAPIGLRLHVNDNDYKAVFQISLWNKNLIRVSISAETQALTSERRSIKVFTLYGQHSRNDNFVMKQILTAKPTIIQVEVKELELLLYRGSSET